MVRKQLYSSPFILAVVILVPCLAASTSHPIEDANRNSRQEIPQDVVDRKIHRLIQDIIEHSRIRLSDGTYATPMPILASNDDIAKVKSYGSRAPKALQEYVNSTQGLEQHLALRFLTEFHDDSALIAIRAFAEKSAIPGIRQIATMALTGFPPEKVKPIIESISDKDPNPDVRAHARHVLATFLAKPRQ